MVKSIRDKPKEKACILIQTIRKNMGGFTKHEVKAANLTHQAQSILAYPSDREYIKVVSAPSSIINVTTRPSDIYNTNIIYGK